VWDENHRNGQDDELRRLVLRDRNHPSIVIWSICNEKLCDTSDTAGDGKRLHDLFHSLDPHGGRVVSANYNNWLGADTLLDVQGVDYATSTYDKVHANAPEVPVISSETSSAVSDRGEYTNNATAGHVTGYDTQAPGWGQTAEGAWSGIGQPNGQGILTRPFVSGGFTWTGWDYKGERTPYGWPDINSHFGILDITGFPKDRFFWYKAWFRDDPALHIFPHWNWGDGASRDHLAPCSGMCSRSSDSLAVDVWAFSNGASVELFVNGKSLGVRANPHGAHVEWKQVRYEPGEIRAVAYDSANGTVATDAIETTGPAAGLRASIKDGVGGTGVVAGCNDVALVQVEVVDAKGRVVPTAAHNVTLSWAAGLTYLGGGNGDPASLVPDKSAARPAFHGLLLGVFASQNATGTYQVRASTPGLESAELNVDVKSPPFSWSWWCDPAMPQL